MKKLNKTLNKNKPLIDLLLTLAIVSITIVTAYRTDKVQSRMVYLEHLNYQPQLFIGLYYDSIDNCQDIKMDQQIIEIENKGRKLNTNFVDGEAYAFLTIDRSKDYTIKHETVPLWGFGCRSMFYDSTSIFQFYSPNLEDQLFYAQERAQKLMNEFRKGDGYCLTNLRYICRFEYQNIDNQVVNKYFEVDYREYKEISVNEGDSLRRMHFQQKNIDLSTIEAEEFTKMILNI